MKYELNNKMLKEGDTIFFEEKENFPLNKIILEIIHVVHEKNNMIIFVNLIIERKIYFFHFQQIDYSNLKSLNYYYSFFNKF